jgi:hypothetical protein
MSNKTKELKITSLERLGILKKRKIKKGNKVPPQKGLQCLLEQSITLRREEREKCGGSWINQIINQLRGSKFYF